MSLSGSLLLSVSCLLDVLRPSQSVGRAAVVGDVLQAAQQSRVVVGTNSFRRRLLLQRDAALPGRSLSGPDHAVDLLEALRDRGQRTQNDSLVKDQEGWVEWVWPHVGGAAADVVVDLVSWR